MDKLLLILLSVTLVSFISFSGLLVLGVRKKFLESGLKYFVAFAAGALLSVVFFDVLPESVGAIHDSAYMFALVGLMAFFMIERSVHWHHNASSAGKHVHPRVWVSLIGDGIHNFTDGVAIAASFLVSTPLGIVTTIAVILHEIPQEIGDFAVLVSSGLTVKQALFYNFLSALTAVAGGLLAFWYLSSAQWAAGYMIAFAAGGLLYLSVSDLLPELHKGTNPKQAVGEIIALVFGVVLIYVTATAIGA